MTGGHVSGVVLMRLSAFFVLCLGVKWMILIGMAAWVAFIRRSLVPARRAVAR